MKKLCLAVMIAIVLSFTGCVDDTIYHWEFEYEVTDVTEIKIINASGAYTYSVEKELNIDFAPELFADIMNLEMKEYGFNLSHPYGLCFLIRFSSGEYDIISQEEPIHYRYDGDRILAYSSWLCCNEAEFDALVNKYLALAHTPMEIM